MASQEATLRGVHPRVPDTDGTVSVHLETFLAQFSEMPDGAYARIKFLEDNVSYAEAAAFLELCMVPVPDGSDLRRIFLDFITELIYASPREPAAMTRAARTRPVGAAAEDDDASAAGDDTASGVTDGAPARAGVASPGDGGGAASDILRTVGPPSLNPFQALDVRSDMSYVQTIQALFSFLNLHSLSFLVFSKDVAMACIFAQQHGGSSAASLGL